MYMDAVWDALRFGFRVTWWLIQRTWIGYASVFRWWEAKNQSVYLPFPVIDLGTSIVLTGFWLWMFVMSSVSN